ncbi:hypothetical protein [Mycobacterium sp. NPDC004974]
MIDMSGGYLAFGSVLKSLARNMAPASGAKTVSSQHHSVSMFAGAALSAFARRMRRSQCRVDALIDPATADLSSMPPVMIKVGADELLFADSELATQRQAGTHAACGRPSVRWATSSKA